jgi:hypothetical protein
MTDKELLTKYAKMLVDRIGLIKPNIMSWRSYNTKTHWLCGEAKVNGELQSISFQYSGGLTKDDFRNEVARLQQNLPT